MLHLATLSLVLFSFLSSVAVPVSGGGYAEGRRPDHVEKQLTDPKSPIYSGAVAKPIPAKSLAELPKSHNLCDIDGKSFCTASWNQHIPNYCGACWIHGALGAANDRLKMLLNGKHDLMLARQVILNCGESRGFGTGCNGGESFDVFEYMHRYGLPDESCQIYEAKSRPVCNEQNICENCMPIGEAIFPFRCWAVPSPILYYVHSYGHVSGEAAIMTEIHARGPITCGLATIDDFDYNYRGGVYVDKTNATAVNHDVEVVGWGETDDGLKYWIARNSWGTYWGENGFFRIARGTNNMQFEADCVFALFDVHHLDEVLQGRLGGSMYGVVQPPESEVFNLTLKHLHGKGHGNPAPKQHDEGHHAADEKEGKGGGVENKEQPLTTTIFAVKNEDFDKKLESLLPQGKTVVMKHVNIESTTTNPPASESTNPADYTQYMKQFGGMAGGSNPADFSQYTKKYAAAYSGAEATPTESSQSSGHKHEKPAPASDAGAGVGYDQYSKAYTSGDYTQYAKQYAAGANGSAGGSQSADTIRAGAQGNTDHIKAASDLAGQFAPNAGAGGDDKYGYGKWSNGGAAGESEGAAVGAGAGGDYTQYYKQYMGGGGVDYSKYYSQYWKGPGAATDANANAGDSRPASHKSQPHSHTSSSDSHSGSDSSANYAPVPGQSAHHNAPLNTPPKSSHSSHSHSDTTDATALSASDANDSNSIPPQANQFNWQQFWAARAVLRGQTLAAVAELHEQLSSVEKDHPQSKEDEQLNKQLKDAILDAYHSQHSISSSSSPSPSEEDKQSIVDVLKRTLSRGGDSASHVKDSILQAIEEIQREAKQTKEHAKDAGSDIADKSAEREHQVQKSIEDALDQVQFNTTVADRVVDDLKDGASSGIKTAQDVIEEVRQAVAGGENQQVINLAEASNLSQLEQATPNHSVLGAVVAGSVIGGMLTAAVMYLFVMKSKHHGYEQIRQME